MRDEAALRRPGWDEAGGAWIALADGRDWLFPKPWCDPTPRLVAGRPTHGPATLFGAGFDAKLAAVRDARTHPVLARALFALAIDLLGRHYELGPRDYADLLRYDPAEGAEGPTWEAVLELAVGVGERTLERWRRLSLYLAVGYAGPLLLEDARDLAGMAAALRLTVPAERWVDELRQEAEAEAWAHAGPV